LLVTQRIDRLQNEGGGLEEEQENIQVLEMHSDAVTT
jgi:hypothetical protein